MFSYNHLDFPHFVGEHLKNFKVIAIYDPSPSEYSHRTKGIIHTVPKSADAVWIELPPAFSLIAASQLQITAVQGYGLLSIKTVKRSKGCQLLIRQGISYAPCIEEVEQTRLRHWRNQIYRHWCEHDDAQ